MKHAMILCLALLASACAHVERLFDGQPGGVVQPGGDTAGYFFQLENDSIAPGNRDKYYTQGLRWQKTFANRPGVDTFADKLCSTVKFCEGFNYRPVWSSGVGQTMYTPDDITITTTQPFDRPWAGFIYLDNTLRLVELKPVDPTRRIDKRTQLVFELQTGHIGKKSGADWAQSGLHAIIDSPKPTWVDQLERPVAAELIYFWNRRYGTRFIDFLPYAGGAAGSTMVYANAGAHVRVGRNLSGFMNTGPMQATFAAGDTTRPPWEWWFYVGGNAAYIPYNYFLSEGDIEPRRRVRDVMAGASLRFRSYRLTYNFVRRGREFDHPLAPPFGAHDYGSLVLSYELVIP